MPQRQQQPWDARLLRLHRRSPFTPKGKLKPGAKEVVKRPWPPNRRAGRWAFQSAQGRVQSRCALRSAVAQRKNRRRIRYFVAQILKRWQQLCARQRQAGPLLGGQRRARTVTQQRPILIGAARAFPGQAWRQSWRRFFHDNMTPSTDGNLERHRHQGARTSLETRRGRKETGHLHPVYADLDRRRRA